MPRRGGPPPPPTRAFLTVCPLGGLPMVRFGHPLVMLWTIFVILGIIAFALVIFGRRSV